MRPIFRAFQGIFSSRFFSFISLSAAILFKLLFTYYFFVVDNDKLYQVLAGKNLAEGHGLTIKQVHATDLSKEVYEPMVGWPPGYSLLFSGLYVVSKNLKINGFLLDIFATVLFFLVYRKIMLALKIPPWLINVLLLFNALYLSEYVLTSIATDLMSVAFCLLTIYLTMVAFQRKEVSLTLILGIAIFNFMPAFLRYMYYPATLIIPLFILWNGIRQQIQPIIRAGIMILSITLAAVTMLIIFQLSYTGNAAYLIDTEKGIFWSNLTYVQPIIVSSFINMNFYAMQLSIRTGINYDTWTYIMHLVNILPFLFLLVGFLGYLFRKKFTATNVWDIFLLTSGMICFSILAELAYLSLTNSKYLPMPNNMIWTYIHDSRYYLLLSIVIPIFSARFLFLWKDHIPWKTILQFLFIFFVSVEILHGIYYLGKNFSWDRSKNKDITDEKALLIFLNKKINESSKKNMELVAGSYSNLANWATMMGGKGFLNQQELNGAELRSSKPVLLIVPIRENELLYYLPFLSRDGVKDEGKIGEFYIYSYYIAPNASPGD